MLTENGVAAMERLGKAGPKIDLVIRDIEMPESGSCASVRRVCLGAVTESKDIPVAMLSGEDTDDNVTKGKYHRIGGFPPDASSLRAHMRHALGLPCDS